MYRNLFYSVFFILVLGLVGACVAQEVDPNLVGWWKLDEGSGTIAYDSSSYFNDGTLRNGPQWVAGRIGGALDLDGTNDYVDCGASEVFDITEQITLSVWVKPEAAGNSAHQHYLGKGNNAYCIKQNSWNNLEVVIYIGGWKVATLSMDDSYNGIWHHFAGTYDGSQIKLYIDGVLQATTDQTGAINTNTNNVQIGTRDGGQWFYNGVIDDVRLYSRALSETEIKKLGNPAQASNISPANGALINESEVTLEWEAGFYAASHDVYFGEDFTDVNSATESTPEIYKGRQLETQYPPDGSIPVELGKTYYWRIDEINEPNIWRGDVWSFTILGETAINPAPQDGAKYVDINVTLEWTAGLNSFMHYLYFGDNFQDVQTGTASRTIVTTPSWTPGQLEFGKSYYWRVDEFSAGKLYTGEVWSFTTVPETPITDPNLVGCWKLDDGEGRVALDWSGYGNNGAVVGNPQWVSGQIDGALDFDGFDDCINCGNPEIFDINESISLLTWVKTDAAGNSADQSYVTKGDKGYALRHSGDNNIEFRITDEINALSPVGSSFNGQWQHLAGTYDGSHLKLYINGELRTTTTSSELITTNVYNVNIARESVGNRFLYEGAIDDVRIYNRALTQEEIKQTMRGDPLLAWNPQPANGSTRDIEHISSLSWSPGNNAVEHDVYFGTDRTAVADANASDTTNIYKGRQSETTYTPPEAFQMDQIYYWRIDEYNADATITKGKVWSFTVAVYLTVDDFEDYNDTEPYRIFDTWVDGWGVATNGSIVGYSKAPFAEQTIINNGSQSMPLFYDNTGSAAYSEATRTFDASQDWTRRGVQTLTLFFRGYPQDFIEDPAGTYTMSVNCEDIWGDSDEFRYAYKIISGDGSITARVVSVDNTDSWAKAGVMIRETVDPFSKHGFMLITPDIRRAFQNRPETAGDSFSAHGDPNSITLPGWVRLVRQGNDITAYYSEDGVNWTQQPDDENTGEDASPNPQTIIMRQDVYVGLAYSGGNANAIGAAVFDNVTTTGTIIDDDWQVEAIGIEMPSNDPAPLYIAVQGGGTEKVVEHPDDPNAVLQYDWQQWDIPLSVFSDAGVNLSTIQKMTIGVGSEGQNGAGTLYVDDIRLYPLIPEPDPNATTEE